MTTLETGDDPISNVGAAKYLEKMGDKDKEVPFTGITDPQGKKIDSMLGLPSSSDEVHKFMTMVKQGAPKMTLADLRMLEAQVRNTFGK